MEEVLDAMPERTSPYGRADTRIHRCACRLSKLYRDGHIEALARQGFVVLSWRMSTAERSTCNASDEGSNLSIRVVSSLNLYLTGILQSHLGCRAAHSEYLMQQADL